MKAKMKNRILSLLLCVVMLVGVMPTAAFAASTPVTTDKVYTYQKIDSVDDIVPGKHFIIVAEYTNETSGETSYHALGAKMAFYGGFRYAYQQDNDEYYGVGKTFEISADKNTITTYYNDTNYEHNYKNDYSKNEPEHGILRLRFEPYDLTKNQYRFAVDGHGYMFGFTSRGNDGTAGHDYHAKMPIGTSTSGEPWWQLSVGSNGYWQICTQTTYGSYDGRITGFERIQSYIYPHHGIAATAVYGSSIESFPEANTGILLYMETECSHYIDTLTHIEGKSATCGAPGIKECWYCSDCETYFANEALSEEMAVEELFVAALPHTASCGHDKETARFELCLDTPSGSNESGERHLLIGKAGDKYYAMGNVTNADGSRNAVEVVPNENGIIAADSDQAEFLTYTWPDNGPIGYFADGGYFSVYEGKVLSYDPSLENANKYIPEPADFRIEDYDIGCGNFGVYSYTTRTSEYIGFDAATLTFKGVSERDDSTYLYCELCPHKDMEHVPADPPTCTQQGSEEYWYCYDCYQYYQNNNFEVPVQPESEWGYRYHGADPFAAPALNHKYNSEGVCENCGMNRPVYTPVTSLAQFDQLSEDASYIIVFKDGSKAYAAFLPINVETPYDVDDNNDGIADILTVDANANEVPDVIEEYFIKYWDYGESYEDSVYGDKNGNGVLDAEDFKIAVGDYLGEDVIDMDAYITFFGYCYEELADAYRYSLPNFVEVTIAADGSVTIIDEGAMEFQLMEAGVWGGQEYDEEFLAYDKEEYGIQDTDRLRAMWIPNWWVANNGMLGYFGEDHLMCQYRQYGDNQYPGVMDNKNWKINFNNDGTVHFVSSWSELPDSGALQLVKYGDGKMTMVGLSEDMWEYSEIMSSSTAKLPAYLYASEPVYAEPPHTCDFGAWSADENADTHSRTCADPECGKTETVKHNWDDGAQVGAPTCTEDAAITYTCTDCGATKTETIEKLGHDWSDWTDDGENAAADTHTRTCLNGCGQTEQEAHSWSGWTPNGESGHSDTCSVCSGTRAKDHSWDSGVVTAEPTHTADGETVYTCTVCSHSYSETIPALPDHEWGKWLPSEAAEGVHFRACICGAIESAECAYDDGVVTAEPTHTAEGVLTYTCVVCDGTKTESIPVLSDHEWDKWADNGDGTHKRDCACGEVEAEAHAWGDWTELAEDSYQRVCAVCDAAETMVIDKPVNTTPEDNAADTVLGDSDMELIDKVLTSEEQSQVAQGAEVKIYLQVEDISENVSNDHKAEAEAKAGDSEIGMYLDIDLFKQVGTAEEVPVSETSSAVTVTITIPEELRNSDPDVKRTYTIVRVHELPDGTLVTDVIEGEFNAEDNTFTFETDKFSTYALAYADGPAVEYLLGDVNMDGSVDSMDTNILFRYANGDATLGALSAEQLLAADANQDGYVDSMDTNILFRYASEDATLTWTPVTITGSKKKED